MLAVINLGTRLTANDGQGGELLNLMQVAASRSSSRFD